MNSKTREQKLFKQKFINHINNNISSKPTTLCVCRIKYKFESTSSEFESTFNQEISKVKEKAALKII